MRAKEKRQTKAKKADEEKKQMKAKMRERNA